MGDCLLAILILQSTSVSQIIKSTAFGIYPTGLTPGIAITVTTKSETNDPTKYG